MQSTNEVHSIRTLIDQHKISTFQWKLIIICFFIVLLDGFDIAIVAYIASILKTEMQLSAENLSYLFVSGVIGLMLGSMLFGPLADNFGRKKILVISTLFYGLSTICCGLVSTFHMLVFFRFLTGLGLGGSMPICIALCAEYSPQRHRMMLCTLSWSGFTLGIAMGGVIATHMLEGFSWHWLFYLGGVLPLLAAVVVMIALPESLEYLLKQNNSRATLQLKTIMLYILKEKAHQFSISSLNKDVVVSRQTVRELFTKENRVLTVLLWSSFFLSLGIFYLLTYWIPILFEGIYSFQGVNLLTAMLPIGGTIGAFILAWWIDCRKEPFAILAYAYLFAFLLLSCITYIAGYYQLLLVVMLLVGFAVAGAQNGLNLVAATVYPSQIRATGVSWAMASGRLGSIVGSYIGVWLVGYQQLGVFFHTLSLGAFVCGMALFSIYLLRRQC